MGMDIKPINYAEEYHVMKPSLFRESENLDRLLQALFDVCDVQQKGFLWLAENLLNLNVAQGFHLDFIGSVVGQPRFLTDFNTEPYFGYEGSYQSKTFGSSLDPEVGGYWNSRSYFNTATSRQLNDDEYRRLIKARAIYNQSNCTANDLLEVINLLSNSKNNTVQMLNHGLIQINTDDSSGIISYFVDRLLNDDNILPIAAGVRVGLEKSTSGSSGGDSTSDTLPLSFLKFEAEIVRATDTITPAIVYSINGGTLKVGKTTNTVPNGSTVNITITAFMAESPDIQNSYYSFEPNLLGSNHAQQHPAQLSPTSAYLMGVSRDVLTSLFTNPEDALPPEIGTDGLVELTLYPASALPNAEIDIDLFQKIIDVTNYNQTELQYFADLGVEPAVKNGDGSYTLKAQLSL